MNTVPSKYIQYTARTSISLSQGELQALDDCAREFQITRANLIRRCLNGTLAVGDRLEGTRTPGYSPVSIALTPVQREVLAIHAEVLGTSVSDAVRLALYRRN